MSDRAGSSSVRWERGSQPGQASAKPEEADAVGEWQTVQRSNRRSRQPESETVAQWSRGQPARDRQHLEEQNGAGRVAGERPQYRSSDAEQSNFRPVSSELRTRPYRGDGHLRVGGSGDVRHFRGGRGGRGRGEFRGSVDTNEAECGGNDGRPETGTGVSNDRGWGGSRGRGFDRRGHNGAGRFNRGDGRGRGGGGGMRGRRGGGRNQSWNFWTLLCGSPKSQVVFTEYKDIKDTKALERGWVWVPLFQPTTDEEVCEKFQQKLQLLAASVAECEELTMDHCKLMAFLRVGDLHLRHESFRFDSRPGPLLEDFDQLLSADKFAEASQLLDRFFNSDDERRHRKLLTSSFSTEKPVENHATLAVFLNMRGFEEQQKTFTFSATLNGKENKFELVYPLQDLTTLHQLLVLANKWNLNIVTAKGTNYQGSFSEVADFRLQFDMSFDSKTSEKVAKSLAEEELSEAQLCSLFERIGDPPRLPANEAAATSWEESERSYRVTNPSLVGKLDYLREQFNRVFVRPHERWPLTVLLRQFKFFKLRDDDPTSVTVFQPLPGVELRVSAQLDCALDREVLGKPEFVSYMWECCQLMQELVATSLEN